tara:strand:+ start:3060 stop:3218 length:159 start_codon:yes stop_codon:yes gene_type:complete
VPAAADGTFIKIDQVNFARSGQQDVAGVKIGMVDIVVVEALDDASNGFPGGV